MSRVAFLDHSFHKKTGSSQFFIDLLRERYTVDVFHLPEDPRQLLEQVSDSGYQCYVLWQTEFCAPYFLLKGQKVLCVPMYDGVAGLPDMYWAMLQKSPFVCFSQELYRFLRGKNIEAYYLSLIHI